MENSSSDSLDALSVSAYGKGLTTNDLTMDSQGTYCELGEQSQQLSQDMFLGSQESQASSISVLECSNSNLKSCRQSGDDFSTITTSSTPFAKRKRGTLQRNEDGSSKSSSDNQRRTKMKCSDKSPKNREFSGGQSSKEESATSEGSRSKNDTILISSASGDNSQLNFSQLDTQLKELTDLDDLDAVNGEHETAPLMLSGKSLSSSNGLNHTGDLDKLSGHSYNSHQIRSSTLTQDKWGSRKTITKTYAVMYTGTAKEVRCESTNQVLSLYVTELAPSQQTHNMSPLFSKLAPVLSSSGSGGGRDSLSSGSVYSAGRDMPFPLRGATHEQRMSCVSSSSSSTLASSAAGLAFRHQMHWQKLSQRDTPPVQCVNCSYEFKAPLHTLLPPPMSTPDLVSSGPENISSSVCEDEAATSPAKTDSPSRHRDPAPSTDKISSPPIPILQATRRSSFTKKFTTLEQIKEEAKHPLPPVVQTACTTLTPKSSAPKRKGRPPKKMTSQKKEIKANEVVAVDEKLDRVESESLVEKGETKQEAEEEQKAKGGGSGKMKKASSAKKKKKSVQEAPKRERIHGDLIEAIPVEENTPPNVTVLAANVYDPGKTVLALWTDKIYYPAVIEEDLQSFLRVNYLDGFVKKIIKQQTIPMSVLIEDTPVQVVEQECENLKPAKLKAFDEETRMCTVEWVDTSLVDTIALDDLRMFPDNVRTIQNRYTHVLESPKLHQLTLDNVLQRKRTPARRGDCYSDGYTSLSSRGIHTSSSSSTNSSKRCKRPDKTPPLPSVEECQNSPGPAATVRPPVKGPTGASASTGKKKKILEEKVDNSGNRGNRCRQRIFGVETNASTSKGQKATKSGASTAGKSSKSSESVSSSSCPPPAKRRRRSKGGPGAPGSPQPSCSKHGPGDRENKFRYSSRWEIEVAEEYCPSSDSEHELESINMLGLEMDFVQAETDQDKLSFVDATESAKAVDKLCGPIPLPGHDLFSGYVFVVSHSSAALHYESDGNLSDQQYAELTSKFPFRRRRLEEQLHKGGGTVYPSLNRVPHEKLEHCLLVTDRPSTTCNFILALAMRVPVLHYYYVIQCCLNKSHIKKYRLPEMSSGYSLEDKCFQDRNLTSVNILGDYMIVIAMSAKRHAIIFWEKVLKFAGASVKRWKPGFDWETLSSQWQNMQVAVLVDDDVPPDILAQPYERVLPTWVIQSLIHAEARDFGAHSAYKEKAEVSLVALSNSETY